MTRCNCGGMHGEHDVGEGDCYRILVNIEDEPHPIGIYHWMLDGQEITEFTLKEQRLYAKHSDGRWSRVRSHSSCNSLPDET